MPMTTTTNSTMTDNAIFGQGSEEVGAAIKSTRLGTSGSKKLESPQRLTISLRLGGVQELIDALTLLKTNERGVKLDIHFGEKTTESGKTFGSSFFFVAPIQEPVAGGGYGGGTDVKLTTVKSTAEQVANDL